MIYPYVESNYKQFWICSHGHKNTVLCVKWNQNGNWVLTASKDQIIKVGCWLFDSKLTFELQRFLHSVLLIFL